MSDKVNILVTGGAGFIGSHIVDALLMDERVGKVRILDNLTTGSRDNMQGFISDSRVEFIEGDIRDYNICLQACKDIDKVCHQAALGSVPRSVIDPVTTNAVNIGGTLNVFQAARENGIKRVVYASSSSVYGDDLTLPKQEDKTGNPMSPYAVTKVVAEMYAKVFATVYSIQMVGLRYFNVFGPRQNPKGPYAAVIPLFLDAALQKKEVEVFGDGLQSRDFTFVDNVIQANVRALFKDLKDEKNFVFNVALGDNISILHLIEEIEKLTGKKIHINFKSKRQGDIYSSMADISSIKNHLNYKPYIDFYTGLGITYTWFLKQTSTSKL